VRVEVGRLLASVAGRQDGLEQAAKDVILCIRIASPAELFEGQPGSALGSGAQQQRGQGGLQLGQHLGHLTLLVQLDEFVGQPKGRIVTRGGADR
jgi:hypothetical protein